MNMFYILHCSKATDCFFGCTESQNICIKINLAQMIPNWTVFQRSGGHATIEVWHQTTIHLARTVAHSTSSVPSFLLRHFCSNSKTYTYRKTRSNDLKNEVSLNCYNCKFILKNIQLQGMKQYICKYKLKVISTSSARNNMTEKIVIRISLILIF